MAELQRFSLSPSMLRRGFWLYVWIVTVEGGAHFHYVGRTGDSSSINAQSPFSRVSGHLGSNENANQIRKHMLARGYRLEDCTGLEMVAFGPVHEESGEVELHRSRRDSAAALEKALCDAMSVAGYSVLNRVFSRKPLDASEWDTIRSAFGEAFPLLNDPDDVQQVDV